ncbi:phage tail tape measure protein [Paenibacillus sp. FSL K6-1122]|uniref:phage tail tape measure protein n=1 Tax=Paenibacillus sp. FSL K6-1122 TaxID=2954512 RepID=UPI0030EE9D06
MNDLKILIDAGLNMGSSVKNLNQEIKALGSHPSLKSLNLKVDIDKSFVKSMNEFVAATKVLSTALEQQQKVINESVKTTKMLDGSIEKVTQRQLANGSIITQTTKKINEETKAYSEQKKTLQQLEKELDGYSLARTRANKNKLGEINSTTNTYKNQTGQQVSVNVDNEGNVKNYSQITDYLKQQQDALQKEQAINKQREQAAQQEYATRKALADKNLKEEEQRNQQFLNQLKTRFAEEQKIARDRDALDKAHYQALQQNKKVNDSYTKSLDDMSNKLAVSLSNYQRKGNKEAVDGIKELQSRLSQFAETKNVANYKSIMQQLNSEFNKLTTNAKVSGQSVNGLGNQFSQATRKVALWLGATAGVFAPIRMLRSGLQDIYDMDKAMTDLMKVTDETDETYRKFVQTASTLADSIGNTTLNVMKSSAEWARLGYDIQTAQNMAKQTLVYQNVGDIKTPEDASKQLISSIKGFGIEVDREASNVAKVVDIYNEVGNKFAISTDGIGQAVQRSASSLSTAGNTIEESVALITAANTTVQDPAKVGNSLKTLSMRLRGVDEDGSAVDGLLPKLEDKFQSIGLTLKKDEKTFKNTYEIFSDLHSVWDRLSDIQRADVLELVAGKMQGNIAASMIENWNDAEGALEAGLNSFGSAAKENAAFLESMQGHIAKFKNAVSEYWGNSASREFLNSIIDTGTKLIRTLGNVGRTVGILGGLFIAFRSKAIIATTVSLYQTIAGLFATKTALDVTSSSASRATKTMILFQRSLGIFGLAVGVISTLIAVFSQLDNATEKFNDTIDKTNSKHEKLSSELQDATSYYKENYDEISKSADVKNKLFDLQNRLIDTYGAEASGLDLVNGRYDEQIAKLDELQQKKLKNEIDDNQFLVNTLKDQKFSTPELGNKISGFASFFGKGEQSYNLADGGGFGDLGIEEYYKKLLDLQDKLRAKNTDIFASSSLIPKTSQEWQNALDAVGGKLDELEPSINQINKLEESKKKYIENNITAQQDYNDTQKELFNTVTKSLSKLPTDKFEEVIKSASTEIKNFDGANLEKTVATIARFGQLEGNPEVVQSLYDIFTNAKQASDGMYLFGESSASATEESKKYADAVNETIGEIGELNDTLYNLSKGQSLSANEMNNLILKYPQLSKNVIKLKDGYTIEKSALETLKKTKVDYFKTLETLGQKEVIGNKQALIDKMKIWGIEIEALSTLAELNAAKAQVDMNIAAEVVVEDITGKGIENQAVINQAKKAQQAAAGPYKELLDRIYDLNSSFKTMVSSLDGVGSAQDKDKKSTEKLNNTYTDTNEILTETQKRLLDLADAIKKVQNERSTMVKGSKEYLANLKEEKKLLEDSIATSKKALKNPSELVSTKVKTTTKTASGEPEPTSTGTYSSPTTSSSGGYSGKYADIINKYASKNGVDPKLIAAIIATESTFNPNAKSHAGATGLMQLMPGTAKGLGVKNSYDPEQNVAGGTKYISDLLKKYNGNVEYALAAYNGGPGNVDKWIRKGQMGNIPFAETKAYAPKVLAAYSEISGSKSPTSTPSTNSSATKVKTTSSDGKTTTEIIKATQKEQDDAIREEKQNLSSKEASLYQVGLDIVETIIAGTDNEIAKLQSKRELSANKQSRYTQDSPEWRKEEMAQSSYLQQEQKLVEQQNKDIRQQLIEQKITQGEYDAKLAENSAKWWDYQSQIDDKRKSIFDSQIAAYEKQVKADDDALAVSDANLKLMTEGTVEYNKELHSQIPILEHKGSVIAKEIEYTKSLLANNKQNAVMTAYYNDKLQELNLSLLGTNSALADVNKTLKDLRESATDNIIDEYKKVIEQQRDLALEALDQEREKEDKRHDERTKNIDKEQKQFENYINARLKAFDRENTSTDYTEELTKKMDERQKIQDRINVLSADNSMAGKAKRKELEDQLIAIDEEIRKYQRDRDRELVKQGLQDQLDDHKNYNDKIKDEEDKQHQDALDKLDDEKKKTERKYKDILEDQKYFYNLKQGLMSNDAIVVTATLGIIGGEYDKLFANMKTHIFETSKEMQNLVDQFELGKSSLDKFKSGDYSPTELGSGGSTSGNGSTGQTGTIKGTTAARVAWTEYLSNKQSAESIKAEMSKLDKASSQYKNLTQQFDSLKSKNDQLRSVYNFPDGSFKDLVNQKIFSAETGGMTPAGMGKEGKFLLAHEKELILNKSDTSNLLKVVDVVRGITDKIRSGLDFTGLFSKAVTTPSTNDNRIQIDKVEIHANDKDSGSSLLNKFENALNNKLKTRTI